MAATSVRPIPIRVLGDSRFLIWGCFPSPLVDQIMVPRGVGPKCLPKVEPLAGCLFFVFLLVSPVLLLLMLLLFLLLPFLLLVICFQLLLL